MLQRKARQKLVRADIIFQHYLTHSSRAEQERHLFGILRIADEELGQAFYRRIESVPLPGGQLQLLPLSFHNHFLLWKSTGAFMLSP